MKYEAQNEIRVIARNSDQPNSRWYSGTGIYRPVYLWTGDQKYIPVNGIKIHTVSYMPAVIEVEIKTSCPGMVNVELLDKEHTVLTKKIENTGNPSVFRMEIPDAKLWDCDHPNLYTLCATFGEDVVEETFGIRLLEWSPENGLTINGKREILRGACVHHDNGVLGACTYPEAEARRVRILKENGYNAIRSSHYPCSKDLLDACDRQGMLVMDEYVDVWYIHKTKYDYLFFRKGYTLLGWNTRADGSGQAVGLGSRIAWKAGLVLYAQWTPWTDEADFIYKKVSGFAVITGYSGKAQQICIPPSLGGLPVRTIRENAFADTDCKTVILSPGIYEIEKWAFRNSHLEQLYLYDDLEKISDYAFQDCDMLHTLHINAIEAPAYSGNYFDTFQDKYDRLLSMKDKKKIVLFSGSSTRFGYDSEMIDQAFPDYEVVNMGVFAYSPALPQLELIRSCMKEGDVLLDSPEFDAANRQFCYQKELDYATFAMMESDYDVFAQLDLREYKQIFTAFTAYQDARADMERKNYDVCASEYDEDGNEVEEPSYNEYGDYVVYRPNSTSEKPIYGLPVNYTVNAYPKDTYIDSINTEFQRFLDQGIKVYFTYSPGINMRFLKTAHRRKESGCMNILRVS